MTTPLALHIFKKDARRLWWEITVTLGLLAYLAHMDSNRADYMIGPMEGLMNLVLPIAWAYLIALCIHQEPIVGDRQFWLTRPYPRLALMLSKLLFATVFIHVPSFIADCFVVQARGFSALEFVPILLQKQMVFALAITIPAIAIAAAAKNMAQIASAGLIAVIGWYFLVAAPSMPWIRPDATRRSIVIGLVAVASAGIIALQYFKRGTTLSRLVGATAFAGAFAVAAYLSPRVTASVRCRDARGVSIVFEKHGEPIPEHLLYWPQRTITTALPVGISGGGVGHTILFEPLEVQVTAPDGKRWATSRPARPGRPRELEPVSAHVVLPPGKAKGWMLIQVERAVFAQIAEKPVRITARFAATVYERGSTSVLALDERPISIPGLGRCSTAMVQQIYSREDLLKVICESPHEIPVGTHAELVPPGTAVRWSHRLGDAGTHVTYPTGQWLSPINRRQTFFHIVEGQPQAQGSQWLVPRSALAGARVELTPDHDQGCGIVPVELADIDLRSFTLRTLQSGAMLGTK